jgi:hypothetical protein
MTRSSLPVIDKAAMVRLLSLDSGASRLFMAAQIFTNWHRIADWLRHMGALQQAS